MALDRSVDAIPDDLTVLSDGETRLASVLQLFERVVRKIIEAVLGVLDRGGQGPCRIQVIFRPRSGR
jgi:hypothetical protein